MTKITRKQISMADRAQVFFFLKEKEKELGLREREDDEICRLIHQHTGISLNRYSLMRMRLAIGWNKQARTLPHNLKFHIDDWEQRLKALEERVQNLEEISTAG